MTGLEITFFALHPEYKVFAISLFSSNTVNRYAIQASSFIPVLYDT